MIPIDLKKSSKDERERLVLLGLVDHYIKTGKPVGSNTLKECGFDNLSSATIRNYFADLEKKGYLTQLHISGGRLPTNSAYRLYADWNLDADQISAETSANIKKIENESTKEITRYLQEAAESLSSEAGCPCFLSAPRFDQDFVVDVKLVAIDPTRLLCVLITNFGLVQTELYQVPHKLSAFSIKRIESYFHWRLSNQDKPENLTDVEEKFSKELYNELMVRYIVSYSTFIDEEIYRTGFSRLLDYSDFHETQELAKVLALFENAHSMRLLLRECTILQKLKFWIGEDLLSYTDEIPSCAVISAPYSIYNNPVGGIGLLGPTRISYPKMISLLRVYSKAISEGLTRNLYKYKIHYRTPKKGELYLPNQDRLLLGDTPTVLLEDKGDH